MKHLFLCVLACGALVACGCASDSSTTSGAKHTEASVMYPAQLVNKTITVDGTQYKYAVYEPTRKADQAVPMILYLHGSGECGTDGVKPLHMALSKVIDEHPEQWPAVVIVPQKPVEKEQWEAYDGVLMAMIASAEKDYTIDRDRVYLTGLSQGGHGTWAIGALHPEMFAALVPVCGYGEPAQIAPKIKNLPVWAFHGGVDDVVQPTQTINMIAAIKAESPKYEPKMTIFPNANHNAWDPAYTDPELPKWLFAQRRSPAK